MAVPFIDLQRFEPGFMERWIDKCREITTNTQFICGPEAARLERELAQEAGVAEVVGVANGTDAMQLALRAIGVGSGDLVLIPDATFWATFEAVVNVGARPVTVDISLTDLQMDFDLFRQAVADYRPKAAILVNLYGWASARLDDFREFCRKKNVLLVEDSAQSYGVTWRGASIFRDAFIATTSFYVAKVLGSCGDAGAVYCSSRQLADVVRKLGNHGRESHYSYGCVGWNSRMGGFDAAFLNLSHEYVARRIESRRRSAAWYRSQLPDLGVKVIAPPAGYEENGYLNVTLHDPEQRPRIEAVLKQFGIGFGNVYPGSMSTQRGAAGWLAGRVGGERADWLSRAVLNLPLFAYMRDEELSEVLAVLKKSVPEQSHGRQCAMAGL